MARFRVAAVAASACLGLGLLPGASSAGEPRVSPSAAPPSTASAFAIIGTIPTSGEMWEIGIANSGNADSSDDTVFASRDSLYVFPPRATTGSSGVTVSVSGVVRALGVGSQHLYLGLHHGLDDSVVSYPLNIAAGATPLTQVPLGEEPEFLTVDGDDSVYVTYYNNRFGVDEFSSSLGSTRFIRLPADSAMAPQGITGLAVQGGTLFSTAWNGNDGYVSRVALSNTDDSSWRGRQGERSPSRPRRPGSSWGFRERLC